MDTQELNLRRNELGRCPCCKRNVKDRKISLYKGIIDSLYRVYCWLGENRRHEFEMRDIRHLLGKSEYTRFGNLVRFGGVIYRPGRDEKRRGYYGMNMMRAKEFFAGNRTIPIQITLNQVTDEIVEQIDCYYHEFPSLLSFIKEHGLYDYEKQIAVEPAPVPEPPKKKRLRPVINRETNTVRFVEE